MYYNKDLVDKYIPGALDDGIVTYEEINQAGEKAKADGVYSFGYTWGMQNYSNLYQQMGGQWQDQDGKINIDNEYSYTRYRNSKILYDAGYMVPDGGRCQIKLFCESTVDLLAGRNVDVEQYGRKSVTLSGEKPLHRNGDAENIVQGSGVDQFAMFKTKEERSDEKKEGMVDFLTWLQANQFRMGEIWRQSNFTSDA